MKPLFIPLRKQWFEAFASGAKTTEFREYGPRWNERTCVVGRKVTLSCGYNGRRLRGRVVSFRRERITVKLPGFVEIYGAKATAACIGIAIEDLKIASIPL